jgi:hypothetical protein
MPAVAAVDVRAPGEARRSRLDRDAGEALAVTAEQGVARMAFRPGIGTVADGVGGGAAAACDRRR